jgi:hypothetical protein
MFFGCGMLLRPFLLLSIARQRRFSHRGGRLVVVVLLTGLRLWLGLRLGLGQRKEKEKEKEKRRRWGAGREQSGQG